jgi:hypothetical protein
MVAIENSLSATSYSKAYANIVIGSNPEEKLTNFIREYGEIDEAAMRIEGHARMLLPAYKAQGIRSIKDILADLPKDFYSTAMISNIARQSLSEMR